VQPNTISVKKIVAFMYGNVVPVEGAIVWFNACVGLESYYVSCAMNDLYSMWDNNPHRAHKAEYFCKSLKRWKWINGNPLNQHEAVWPEITVMQFGTENTGCKQIIRTTVEHVRLCTAMSSNLQTQ